MDKGELRALALLLKPHADKVMRIWEEDGSLPRQPKRPRTDERLTAEGYPEHSKYAEIVAGWDAWADWVDTQPDRNPREADALRAAGRHYARGAKETSEKSPRQAAVDARPADLSVDELEQKIVGMRDEEALLQAGLAFQVGGPSFRYLYNCFRVRLLLPPLLLDDEQADPTDAFPPPGGDEAGPPGAGTPDGP